MVVNGKTVSLSHPVTLAVFLTEEGYDITRIAAELNGEIISKDKFNDVILCDSDQLEVVAFVGGG